MRRNIFDILEEEMNLEYEIETIVNLFNEARIYGFNINYSIEDYFDQECIHLWKKGYQNTDIVNMSEIYFHMADEMVFAAENYSEKIAVKIRTIELLSALDMLCLLILVIMQTLTAMKMAMKNKMLEQRAYTDAYTGLPNKGACEALLRDQFCGKIWRR